MTITVTTTEIGTRHVHATDCPSGQIWQATAPQRRFYDDTDLDTIAWLELAASGTDPAEAPEMFAAMSDVMPCVTGGTCPPA